jgi:hypothetical protein
MYEKEIINYFNELLNKVNKCVYYSSSRCVEVVKHNQIN